MGEVKITWLGHSCIRLEKDDYVIVLDPYADGSVPGYPPLRTEADKVLCSHFHGDHGAVDLVTIREGAEAKACPFVITEIESFHDEEGGALRGTNVIRIFDDGEYRIAHMGDIGCMPTEEQKDMLRGVDVMLIPVGGFFTMEPDRIKALVSGLHGHVYQPMEVTEDDEKVVITVNPCGSGGRLMEMGGYEPETGMATIKEACNITFGYEDFPMYCIHCPVMRAQDYERSGDMFFVREFVEGKPCPACQAIFYKDQSKTPDVYYERIGKPNPHKTAE